MQRYGDRLLGYWEGREADLGMETRGTQVDSREDRGRGRNPGNSSEREGERAAVVAPSEAIEDHTRSERGNAEASEKSADNSQGGTAGEEVSTATDSVTQPETAKTATMDVDPPAPVRARGAADPDTALSPILLGAKNEKSCDQYQRATRITPQHLLAAWQRGLGIGSGGRK